MDLAVECRQQRRRFVRRQRIAALDDDVRVGAAGAEGADAGEARVDRAAGRDLYRAAIARMRIAMMEMRLRRQLAGPQALDCLDHGGDAGGGLGMADRGLHRSDEQWPLAAGEDVGERIELDRIAELGARAVRLDAVDRFGLDAGIGQRVADHAGLGGAVGRGEAAAAAVVVDRAAADHAEHAVAVAPGGAERLQHDDAAAFAADIAVGAGVEHLALAVRRQQAGIHQHQRRVGRQHVD